MALKVFTFANSARETPRRVLKFMFNEIMALRYFISMQQSLPASSSI